MKSMTQIANIALVTGADSGMGLEFSRQLAERGCDILMVSNRAKELQDAAQSIRKGFPVRVEYRCVDLSAPDAAHLLSDWCEQLGLSPSILINNAGIFYMEYLSPSVLPKADTMIALHIKAVTDLCILLGSRMKAAGKGYILNMASVTARIPAPGIAVYSATKAYLKSFGKSLSYELRPFGVSVTTVCPAAVDTALYQLSDKLRRTLRRLGLMQTPQHLVSRALRAMFRRRRSCNPGILNVILPPLVGILPSRLIDRLGIKWIYGK